MSGPASKKSDGRDPFMSVEDDLPLTPDDRRSLAFLEEGPRPVGEAPAWLDQVLGGRIAVALCRPTRGAAPRGPWLATEEVAPGCFAVACDGPGVGGLIEAVAAACASGGLAAVALGPGGLGHAVLLGPVPDRAAALFAERDAAGRPGVYVDEAVLAELRVPAVPVGGSFRLAAFAEPSRRRPWVPALAMAAAVVLGFGLFRWLAPTPPEGRIYVVGQRTSMERGPHSDELWRAGDQVVVTLEGEPGAFASVLLLDSGDRLVVPEATAVNVALTTSSQQLEIKKVFDNQPGRERFLGVISRQPVADWQGLLEGLNGQGTSRAERLAALAKALGDSAVVVPAAELDHR